MLMHTGELIVVGRLVMADVRGRPGRLALTILSTVAAACVRGLGRQRLRFARREVQGFGREDLGRYELVVLPKGLGTMPPCPRCPRILIGLLRQDPAVAAVDPAFKAA